MDDLISRQAAIDVVNGIDSHFVKYIEALPSAQPEPQWIPCKREFPQNMEYVLVSDGMGVWEDRLSKHDGIWVESAVYKSDSFTWAWMPLPEPYKGES